jgi:hypothetical protein
VGQSWELGDLATAIWEFFQSVHGILHLLNDLLGSIKVFQRNVSANLP